MGAKGTQSGSRYGELPPHPQGIKAVLGLDYTSETSRELGYAENIVTAQGSSLPQLSVPRAAERQDGDEDNPPPQF